MALMTTRETAEYCRSSVSFLDKRRLAGRPPRYLKVGRHVRYDSRHVDEWLAACERRSTSQGAPSIETPPVPVPSKRPRKLRRQPREALEVSRNAVCASGKPRMIKAQHGKTTARQTPQL
jgi:hypothetical protein